MYSVGNIAGAIGNRFGGGSGHVYHYNVQCLGNEYRLSDCVNGGIDLDRCSHFYDAGVECLAGTNITHEQYDHNLTSA